MKRKNHLQEELLRLFRERKGEWIPTGVIQRMKFMHRNRVKTYTPLTVARQLHLMEEQSLICVGYNGKNAEYRYLPQSLRSKYIPTSSRVPKHSNNRWKPEVSKKPQEKKEITPEARAINEAALKTFEES